jgi:hypothetical protein
MTAALIYPAPHEPIRGMELAPTPALALVITNLANGAAMRDISPASLRRSAV